MNASALIDCEELLPVPGADGPVVLDATFFLPRQRRNAAGEYRVSHIPGARFFDIDAVADLESPLPHTLPTAEGFARAAGELGIGCDTPVVVYDNNHFFAAARVWWMFRVFGHDRVRVLDGGLARWRHLGYPEETSAARPASRRFVPSYRSELVCDLPRMRRIQHDRNRQIVDARSADSFFGQRPLSDPELKPGHIPGSLNLPYALLTDPVQQRLLPKPALRELFAATGVDLTRPIVTSCGSGVSAAVLSLALFQLGIDDVPLYDGSWAEWGRLPDTPKQTAV